MRGGFAPCAQSSRSCSRLEAHITRRRLADFLSHSRADQDGVHARHGARASVRVRSVRPTGGGTVCGGGGAIGPRGGGGGKARRRPYDGARGASSTIAASRKITGATPRVGRGGDARGDSRELRDEGARIRASRAEMRASFARSSGGASRGGGGRGRAEGAEVAKLKDRPAPSARWRRHRRSSAARDPVQMRQVAAARREATERAREPRGGGAGWRGDAPSGAPAEEGGVDPPSSSRSSPSTRWSDAQAHPHGDGARAFYRAARRVGLAARACQPEYRAGGSGMKLKSTATFASPTPGRSQRAPRTDAGGNSRANSFSRDIIRSTRRACDFEKVYRVMRCYTSLFRRCGSRRVEMRRRQRARDSPAVPTAPIASPTLWRRVPRQQTRAVRVSSLPAGRLLPHPRRLRLSRREFFLELRDVRPRVASASPVDLSSARGRFFIPETAPTPGT